MTIDEAIQKLINEKAELEKQIRGLEDSIDQINSNIEELESLDENAHPDYIEELLRW